MNENDELEVQEDLLSLDMSANDLEIALGENQSADIEALDLDSQAAEDLELGEDGGDELTLGTATSEGTQQDITELCLTYLMATRFLTEQESARKNLSIDAVVAETIRRKDFETLDDAMFYTVLSGICELCDEYKEYNTDQAVEYIAERLSRAHSWTPGTQAHKFYPVLRVTINNCRQATSVPVIQTKFSALDRINLKSLKAQNAILTETAFPFRAITSGYAEDSLDMTAVLSMRGIGKYVRDVCQRSGYRQLTVRTGLNTVFEILQSEEALGKMEISLEDAQTLSIGELIRRITLCDLEDNRLTYTTTTDFRSPGAPIKFFSELATCDESIAGSVLDLWFRIATTGNPRSQSTSNFILRMFAYLHQYHSMPSRLRLVVYGSAKLLPSGKFQLGYAYRGKSYTFVSDNLLCCVYGDTLSYKVPLLEYDSANGFVLIPPGELFTQVRSRSDVIKTRLPLNSVYTWEPTTSFARDSGIYIEDSSANDSVFEEEPDIEGNEILALLREYTAEFENDLEESQQDTLVLKLSDGRIIYGVRTNAETATIALIEKDGVKIPITSGTILQTENRDIILSKYDTNGLPSTEVIHSTEYEEELNLPRDSEAPTDLSLEDYCDFGNDSVPEFKADKSFIRDVQSLCDFATIDYEAGINRMRGVASKCFVNILGFHRIYSLLGARLMEYYYVVLDKQSPQIAEDCDGKIEGLNFDTFKDVLQFTCGSTAVLDGKTTVTAEDLPAIKALVSEHCESVASIVRDLLTVDMDALAIQVISHSQPKDIGEDAALYEVCRALPVISEWLCELEHRMLLADILNQLGETVDSIVSVDSTFKYITAATLEQAVASMPTIKAKISNDTQRCNLVDSLWSVLASQTRKSSPACKCAIMNSDLYKTVLGMLEGSGNENPEDIVPEFIIKFLKDSADLDIAAVRAMNHAAFDFHCSRNKQRELFDANREFFIKLVQETILSRLTEDQYSIVIKYQLVRNYHERMLNNFILAARSEVVDADPYDFYSFAMSVFAGYGPVFGDALSRINAGERRVDVFMTASSSFALPQSMVAHKLDFELQEVVDFVDAV